MSADMGPRKRFKDKKRKKESSVGETNVPGIVTVQNDAYSLKQNMNETMHVQNEIKFGGNILSKLIFFVVFLAIGVALVFVFAKNGNSEGDEDTDESSWLPQCFNFVSYLSTDEPIENSVKTNDQEDEISDSKSKSSFIGSFWEIVLFYRKMKIDPHPDDNEPDSSDHDSEDFKDYLNNANNHDNDYEDFIDILNNDEDELKEGNDESDDDSEDKDEADYDNENDVDVNYSKKVQALTGMDRNDEGSNDDNDDDDEDDISNEKLHVNDDVNDYQDPETIPPNYSYIYGAEEDLHGLENENQDFDDDENDDLTSLNGEKEYDESDDESFSESDHGDHEEISDDMTTIVKADSKQTAMNENLVPPAIEDESDFESELSDIGNDNDMAEPPTPYTKNNDHILNEDVFHDINKNETTGEYSETPSESESEVVNDVMRWSASNSADILAHEIGDSESTASDSNADDSDRNRDVLQDQYLSEDYDKLNATNSYDWQFRDELDHADQDFDNHRFTDSLNKYEQILRIHPRSPRAKFGVAKSLDAKAELLKSNKVLSSAIEAYVDALSAPNVPDTIFRAAAERAVNRMRFKGEYESSITIQNLLIERVPDSVSYQNDLVVSLLMLNRILEAKQRLEQILLIWPDNGLALVHYGFVLKMDGDLSTAVHYLSKGIQTNESGTQESRFYFHLGDALQRLGKNDEAMRINENGVEKGLFLSKYQRSLYNVNRLTGRPWWTHRQTTYESFFSKLKKNWKIIRTEGLSLLKMKNSTFIEESEQLRETGDWKQFELFSRGTKRSQCHKAPVTCRLISEFEPAAECRRGQVKFSVMEPGTHVWPHCGPTNCRLRAHLGLVIPSNVTIRVAFETRQWKEGEIMVFDDSFEHEVWHNGTSLRLILIVDVWHPELTVQERKSLAAI